MIARRKFWAALPALLFLFPFMTARPQSSVPQALIDLNIQQGRPMQALYHLEVLAAQTGWNPDLNRQAGDLWNQVGDLSRAIPHWELAATSDPDLLRMLVEAYIQVQRWTEAATALESLLAVSPDERWAHFQLGLIRAAFDPTAAETHLRAAARVPEYADVTADLLRIVQTPDSTVPMRAGLVLAGAELWPYAELAFQHAADIAHPFAEALAYTGIARDWQGKDGSAWIEQAVGFEPQNPVIQYLYGLHLRFHENYPASREAFIRAVALDPLNPAYYMELGAAYRLVDDLQSAERWLRMAVEISQGDSRFQQALEQFYAESAFPRSAE